VVDEIDAWAGDERARAAADARARERWLRQQAVEAADLHGLLLDLAEQAAPVVIALSNGRRHQGTIVGVGVDVATIDGPAGPRVHVAIGAITSVRAAAGSPRRSDRASSRAAPRTGRLAHLLAAEAGHQPRVLLGLVGGETVSGELRSVGTDVLLMQGDGEAGLVYVRLASVCDASLFGSG